MVDKPPKEFAPPNEEDEFIREIMERAKGDLIYVATRILEVVARYFQFRLRELVTKGIYLTHSYYLEYKENGAKLVLEITIPKDIIEKYQREYARRAKIVKQYIRSGKHIDRYRLINKPMASIVEEETIFKKEEEKNTGEKDDSRKGDQALGSKEDL
ncbi:MAG: hypothetical protein DRJ03_28080 [Chloroflexi bacterium]|nr:MAG: hypothetical protein DRJ03_28080 [Chloroflexota bacterium]